MSPAHSREHEIALAPQAHLGGGLDVAQDLQVRLVRGVQELQVQRDGELPARLGGRLVPALRKQPLILRRADLARAISRAKRF